jgi:hypothetical protein
MVRWRQLFAFLDRSLRLRRNRRPELNKTLIRPMPKDVRRRAVAVAVADNRTARSPIFCREV